LENKKIISSSANDDDDEVHVVPSKILFLFVDQVSINFITHTHTERALYYKTTVFFGDM